MLNEEQSTQDAKDTAQEEVTAPAEDHLKPKVQAVACDKTTAAQLS